MRLSPWHCEIAKRVAEGKKFKEISQEIQISQSRLSVLKANSLFMQQVKKYREIKDDAYMSAMKEMEKGAVDAARTIHDLTQTPSVPPQVKLNAATELLDRVGMGSKAATSKNVGRDEVSFEQILRITKRGTSSTDFEQDSIEEDTSEAHKELMTDFEQVIDVSPQDVSPQEAA
jgi:hypothetical protein